MLDKKSERNFERALLHEMEKIKKAARQWHNNNTRGYRDFRSKEAISKSFSEICSIVYELKCAWRLSRILFTKNYRL